MNYFENVGYEELLNKVIIEVEESGLEGYVESFKEYFKGREGDIISFKEYLNWNIEKVEGVIDGYDFGNYKMWNWYDGLFGIDIELFNFEDFYEECCNKGMKECWDNDWEKLSFEMFLIKNFKN